MYQLAAFRAAAGHRRRRPACRWRWPSSATSCRPGSGPSTRATSSPCSARPACSARCSAASSPAPTPSSASPAGAGSSTSTCRSRAAAMIVVIRSLHIPHSRTDHRIDWPGAIALVVGLVPLLIVAEQGRKWGWGSGRPLACYAIGAVGLVAFVLVERWYGDEALLPLRLFRGRTFAIGSGQQLHRRHGDVRRPADAAALPADREGRRTDQGRPGADPVRHRHHGRLDHLRPDHRPDRPVPDLPDHRQLR